MTLYSLYFILTIRFRPAPLPAWITRPGLELRVEALGVQETGLRVQGSGSANVPRRALSGQGDNSAFGAWGVGCGVQSQV